MAKVRLGSSACVVHMASSRQDEADAAMGRLMPTIRLHHQRDCSTFIEISLVGFGHASVWASEARNWRQHCVAELAHDPKYTVERPTAAGRLGHHGGVMLCLRGSGLRCGDLQPFVGGTK